MRINKKEILLVIILLSIFLFQSVATLKNTNLIFDEPATLVVSYYFLKDTDTKMSILHPPLGYILAGFPLLFLDIATPYPYQECTDIGYFQCGQHIMFKSVNDPEKIGIYGRFPFIVLSLLFGLLLFLFSRELYGAKAGFFSLLLYAFSPAILAYNTLANATFTDLLVTFFAFNTVYLLWKLLIQGYTKTRLALIGISLGLALASKFTAILLIPIIMILFSVKIFQESNRKKALKKHLINFGIILLIGSVVLHSTYFFSFDSIADSIPKRNLDFVDSLIQKNFAEGSFNRKMADFLVYGLKIPMPEYFSGFAAQYLIESSKNKEGYLNGKIYDGGKWYYFFEVLLIKTPIPLLIFIAISLFFTVKTTKNLVRSNKYFKSPVIFEQLCIFLPIIFFFGIFIPINFNLGLRHILPIIPFMFLFASQITKIRLRDRFHNVFRIFVGLLLLWYIIPALFIMPHYIAYFNEFVGGPENGHKYLLSSNLDQGQDLKKLHNYLETNNIGKIKLSYHGSFDPSYYNISYEAMPMEPYIPWVDAKSKAQEDCSKKKGL